MLKMANIKSLAAILSSFVCLDQFFFVRDFSWGGGEKLLDINDTTSRHFRLAFARSSKDSYGTRGCCYTSLKGSTCDTNAVRWSIVIEYSRPDR